MGNLKHFITIETPHHFDYYAPDFAQKVYYISVEPDFSAVALFATDWAAGRAQPFAKLT